MTGSRGKAGAAPPAAEVLDRMLEDLEVRSVALTECVVEAGYALEMSAMDHPSLHYGVAGEGRLIIRGAAPIGLDRDTLVIVPRDTPFRVEVDVGRRPHVVRDSLVAMRTADGVRRVVAGDGTPGVLLICGFFDARFGAGVELFGTVTGPVVERFEAGSGIGRVLEGAVAELVAQEVGAGAMRAALLKQVLVSLLRRSVRGSSAWLSRVAMLGDPQIARAFAAMVADPGAAFSVERLAEIACLSRSAFMARFADVVGRPPIAVLRELRMRRAAQVLRSGGGVAEAAREAGYGRVGSFVRAFRRTFGEEPGGGG